MALRRIAALYLRTAASRRIVMSSIRISLVVGTALNLINQWEALSSERAFRIGNFMLNYLVPYCVASFSAARALTRDASTVAASCERDGSGERR